jgi:PAS domain S-box-containing protein
MEDHGKTREQLVRELTELRHVTNLRQKAEEQVRTQPKPTGTMTDAEVGGLVHELQVHQIELEMQNDEFVQAQADLRESSEKYGDLFDFAPIGYFVWGGHGQILEVNLSGANLLGLDRSSAINKRFGQFVALEDRVAFSEFCKHVLQADAKQRCEVKLQIGGQRVHVLIEAVAVQSGQGKVTSCRAAVMDITDRKKTEEALHESEEDYRRLTELSPDGIFVVNGDYIVCVNSAGLRLLGASHVDQIVGRPVLDFIHPQEHAAIKQKQSTHESQRRAQWMEQRAVRLDGGVVDIEAIAVPFVHRGCLTSQVIVRDITDRKKAEEALHESEQRQKAILDNIPDLAWLKDKKGCFLAINPAWCRFFGMNAQDALGKTASELLSPEMAAKFEELDRSIVLSGSLSPYEELLTDEDGRKVWFETINTRLLDDHGDVVGTTGLARDITERKHAEELLSKNEERLRLAAEAANFGAYDYDFMANKLYWSPESKAIWGLRPDDPCPIAENYVHLGVHPDDRANVENTLNESLNPHGSGLLQIEHRIVRLDGSVRWVLAHGRVYFSGDGETRHAVRAAGIFLDITERKQAEERLQASEARLREAQEVACLGSYTLDLTQGRWTSSEVLDRILDVPTDYAWTEERWGGLVHPDERQSMLDYFRNEVLGKHEPFDREYRIVRYGDKKVRWVHGLGRLEFDAAGHPIGILGTIQDITERKQAEEALRKSEAQHRSLFENNLDGIFLARPNGAIMDANPAACAMLGMSKEEIIRVGRAGIVDPSDPRLAALLEKRERMGKAHGELTHIRKDGQKFPAEISSVVLDGDDGRQRAFVMLRDITERKQAEEALRASEERFRVTFEEAPVGMVICVGDGVIVKARIAWAACP